MRTLLLLIVAALIVSSAPCVAAETAAETKVTPDGCKIITYTIASPSMGRDIKVLILLPPEYDANPDKSYPVLYALHGRGASYTSWSQMMPLRKALKTKPMIVASFDGDSAGWYIDSTTKPESQFKTFFLDEFIPHVDATYRSNGIRGVTGFSMGGYGALHYMVARPELFCSISGLSSAMGITAGDDGKGHRNLQTLLGPRDQNRAAYDQIDIATQIAALVKAGTKPPPIMQHCGTEDRLTKNNREFVALLVAQNKIIRERLAPQVADETNRRTRRKKLGALMLKNQIDFSYTESPGGHSWPFWRDASANVVDFHWKHFQKAQATRQKPQG